MPGRRSLLLALLLVLAGATFLVVRWLIPAERFVYGLVPISRDEAVLLTRRNDAETSFWVQLVRADGAVVWETATSPVETSEALGFSGVAASADRVVLLGEREGTTVVTALERATGDPVWEAKVSGAHSQRIGPALLVDGPRIYAVHARQGGGGRETVSALALADGTIRWTLGRDLEETGGLDLALLGPGRLVVNNSDAGERHAGSTEVDGTTGRTRRPLPMGQIGCSTPRGIVGRGSIRSIGLWSGDASSGQEANAHIIHLGADSVPLPDRVCGQHGDDLIVGAQRGDEPVVEIVRVDPERRAVRWRLPLGGEQLEATASMDGRLPRLLPVAVVGRRSKRAPLTIEIVVVDLDAGVVHSRLPVDDSTPFVTGERAYVVERLRGNLVALDPASGAVAHAFRMSGFPQLDVRSEDFRFGRLWLSTMGWGRPSELSWAVIDLDTGRPAHVNGEFALQDATAAGWPQGR